MKPLKINSCSPEKSFVLKINSYSPKKSFEVKSGALRVTDPCYDMDAWCAGTLEDVKNGKWLAHVGYDIDEGDIAMTRKWHQNKIDELQALIDGAESDDERKTLEAWYGQRILDLKAEDPVEGYIGRVAYIAIRHESTIACTPPYLKNFTVSEIHVGVDSGQAGFFDLAPFKAQSETAIENGSYNQDTEHGKFYRSICEQTSNESGDSFAIVPFGAASSSGYGDGDYSLYVLRDKDGLVIEAIIIFIAEYDEEEGEE